MNDTTDERSINTPTDPQTADQFGQALTTAHAKHSAGVPLTRRELLQLSQACLRLIGREGVN